MRRRSSVEPPASSPESPLHPILQGVLSSLDVHLEEELARYRRQKGQRTQTRQWGIKPTRDRKSLDIPSRQAADAALPPAQLPAMSMAPVQPPEAASESPSTPASAVSALSSQLILSQSPGKIAADPQPHGAIEAIDRSAENSSPDIHSRTTGLDTTDESVNEPDDYLASSEELLKSIAEEEELRSVREPALLETLLTPLGIGSMLLLLLSSITLGYLIMNPSTLRIAGEGGWFSDRQSSSETLEEDISATETAPESTATAVPTSPNLASEEFVDLNLENLGTLPPNSSASPAPSPAASPAAANTPNNSNSSSAAIAANPQPPSRPPTVESNPVQAAAVAPRPSQSSPPTAVAPRRPSQPASQPAAVRPAPAQSPASAPARAAAPSPQAAAASTTSASTTTSSNPDPNYIYVTTDYRGDGSLSEAQQAVGDAYVRNFSDGARVQLGAFSDPSRAQELIQELEQQGISAEIYQP